MRVGRMTRLTMGEGCLDLQWARLMDASHAELPGLEKFRSRCEWMERGSGWVQRRRAELEMLCKVRAWMAGVLRDTQIFCARLQEGLVRQIAGERKCLAR